MHFALTYDLSAQGVSRNKIGSRIEEILNPYVHVKRLTTFYIIHVDDNNACKRLRVYTLHNSKKAVTAD